MNPSRRSFGALLAGAAAAGAGARPAFAHSAYPALAALAQLLPDRASCQRLAKSGLAQQVDRAGLGPLNDRVAARLAAGDKPADILHACNEADFRAGRVCKVAGFALAYTEAAVALLRAHPDLS